MYNYARQARHIRQDSKQHLSKRVRAILCIKVGCDSGLSDRTTATFFQNFQ